MSIVTQRVSDEPHLSDSKTWTYMQLVTLLLGTAKGTRGLKPGGLILSLRRLSSLVVLSLPEVPAQLLFQPLCVPCSRKPEMRGV